LIQELESSSARIVLLVAGSGWGKTVLAEQWSSEEGVTAGWFRARPSAADVSVVARGVVAAVRNVVPGVGGRMLERLGATEDPEREAVLLAEMLAEDLVTWPSFGWLVIDDYHEIAASRASDSFVSTLLGHCAVRALILSTVRLSWAGTGAIGSDSVELREDALAMSESEAASLLETRASGALTTQVSASGWPALIGLTSLIADPPTPDVTSAGALYEFCATAVMERLPPELRDDLRVLATLPAIDHEIAGALLGSRAHRVFTECVERGLIDEHEQQFEIHPLFREYLVRTLDRAELDIRAVASALQLYRQRRDWDAAFELVRSYALDDELAGFVLDAVDELLFSGRLSTLLRWTKFAHGRASDPSPVFEIAEMEINLRHGRHATALTQARWRLHEGIAEGDLAHRLSIVAARAAHAGGHEEEALEYYKQAYAMAHSVPQQRDARWGELMCTSALERPEAHEILGELVRSVVSSDARDQVRMADKQLSVGFRFGFVKHLADSRRAAELVHEVPDPFVRCSFLSVHAWALALGSYYEEALIASDQLLADTAQHRVDLVLPYAYSLRAAVLAGLGDQDGAQQAVDKADRLARRLADENGLQNSYATRVRVLLQAGGAAEACAIEPPDIARALPSMRGEVLGSRALALATIGRVDEAAELAEVAAGSTTGIEAQALHAAVNAVCSLKRRTDDLIDRCEALIEHVFENGSPDIAVTAYRANPELLATLLASRSVHDEVVYLTRRAGDEGLLGALGLSTSTASDGVARLSSREREVYELMCEGLSNGEIARRLFITEATVKAHVHHVFDKLGIRSRSALALNAARDRYATSAVTNSGTASAVGEETVDRNPEPRAAR